MTSIVDGAVSADAAEKALVFVLSHHTAVFKQLDRAGIVISVIRNYLTLFCSDGTTSYELMYLAPNHAQFLNVARCIERKLAFDAQCESIRCVISLTLVS